MGLYYHDSTGCDYCCVLLLLVLVMRLNMLDHYNHGRGVYTFTWADGGTYDGECEKFPRRGEVKPSQNLRGGGARARST